MAINVMLWEGVAEPLANCPVVAIIWGSSFTT
jgi:hypothetical protein